ncbi:hypothetical protein [Nocardia sp. NPDC059239]|uniref:hypothetical protein n=1 Tax=Nocardia sp. NPDC059239 TaxID=3346785 RepID=UPI003693D19C
MKLHASPLLKLVGERRYRFSLKVFEQWFAAQSLLDSEVDVDEVVYDIATFNRWRYVLAIVLAAGSPTKADRVMIALTRWNPGAAAWVVAEALRTPVQRTPSSVEFSGDLAPRFRTAVSAWLTGLGTLSGCLGQISWREIELSDPLADITLAVNIANDSRTLTTSWLSSDLVDGRRLPPTAANPGSYIGLTSVQILSEPVVTAANWVWARAQDDLSHMLDGSWVRLALSQVPADGVVHRELTASLPFQVTSEGIEPKEPTDIWPGPDVSPTPTAWGGYSEQRIYERTVAVLKGAMDAYLELVSSGFPKFGDTLGHHATMPLEFEGAMYYQSGNTLMFREPGFRYWLRPIGRPAHAAPSDNTVSLTLNGDFDDFNDYRDDRHTIFERYASENPELEPFLRFSAHSGRVGVLESRPATQIALGWLWQDLQRLRWIVGNNKPASFFCGSR